MKNIEAKSIAYGMGLTLRGNQWDYYYKQLVKLFPEKKIVKKYIDTYGNSYECASTISRHLWYVFTKECDRYGLLYKMNDIISNYKKGYYEEQIKWF